MASLPSSACLSFSASSLTTSSSSSKSSQLVAYNANRRRNQRLSKVIKNHYSDQESAETFPAAGKLDRRNMLIGLGGLYDMVGQRLVALADTVGSGEPVPYPDLSKCSTAYIDRTRQRPLEGYSCCPVPADPSEITKYEIPDTKVMRVRPAAHLVDDKYIEKYMAAIQAMRDLNGDVNNPMSFKAQADIHCAYCNFAHRWNKEGVETLQQVHGNWFFAPFHRWYLYFFEKIAGKLIDDPTFALPYWNWDTPCGMTMPLIFSTPNSPFDPSKPNPLYDQNRNPACYPPAVIDLARGNTGAPDIQKVCNNLAFVYRTLVTNAQDAEDFHGGPLFYGGDVGNTTIGSLELLHNPAHGWVGGLRGEGSATPNGEDMGNFYSAGRDTIFYCHHANVDRLWTVWLNLGGNRKNYKNKAWFDSQYFFWDENKKPVYVTVKDCLNEEKLGYTYQPMELPWLKARPTPRLAKKDVAKSSGALSVANVFPTNLDKVVKVLVQRPRKSRSKQQKEKKKEMLVVEGIEYPPDFPVQFNLFINDEDDKGDVLSKAEFAASFVTVPMGPGAHGSGERETTNFRIGLDDILEDLKADDDEYILVTLIPKVGGEKVTIDNLKIEFK